MITIDTKYWTVEKCWEVHSDEKINGLTNMWPGRGCVGASLYETGKRTPVVIWREWKRPLDLWMVIASLPWQITGGIVGSWLLLQMVTFVLITRTNTELFLCKAGTSFRAWGVQLAKVSISQGQNRKERFNFTPGYKYIP